MPKFVEVSTDEVLEQRKDFANDDGMLFKAFASPKSYNAEERSAVFVMSAETVDRYGDVVVQRGIDTEHFDKNPVAFFNHKSFDAPIGAWSELKTVNGSPRRTEGKMTFTPEGVDDVADRIARHVEAGTIKASSIGFRPKAAEKIMDDDDNWTYGYRFPEIELYECSVVTVPAVREALIKGGFENVSEVLTPEVVEEFLDHLKSNPALAKAVGVERLEADFLEIVGKKTFVPAGGSKTTSNDEIGLEKIQAELSDLQKQVAQLSSSSEEDGEDGFVKSINDDVDQLVSKIEQEAEGEDNEERKGVFSSLIEKLKNAVSSGEPEVENPEPANEEQKSAVSKKFEELEKTLAA